MKKKPQLLAAILTALCLTLTAGAQVTREHETAIRKMMRLTGMIDMIGQMNDQMITQLKQGAPAGVPEDFWAKAREKRMKVEDLVQRMIPVYAKYCSLEDLKAINAFYESPAGQRFVTNLAPMMQENMKIGQAWGQEVSQKVIDDLQAELRGNQTPGGITVPGIGK
jgi:hypothetical protein